MKRLILPTLCALINTTVLADVTVIAKVGQTEPVTTYFGNMLHPKKTQSMEDFEKKPSVDFSVKTNAMSPGFVHERAIHISLLDRPIFIVGDDDLSKKWLREYSASLNKVHAIGFIVNTNGNSETKAIANKFHVTLVPVNGYGLSKRFGLKHYPVLISKNRIEQ